MGVAGAGKSVQGTLLAEKLGYEWLSTGEYLRANISEDRKAQMLAGRLLGDDEIIDILREFFASIHDQQKCILDGFPRTLAQAKWLLAQHESGELKIADIIYLDAPKEVVRERLLARGRADDTPEALDHRFDEYEKLTLPIIDWFVDNGLKVHKIDGNRSVAEIQAEILEKLGVSR